MSSNELKNDLKDHVVIITGATRGIGAGIARCFLSAGAKVVATYQSNDQAANEFKKSLSADEQERLDLRKFDVSSFSECQKFYQSLDEKYPQVHVLINNSGIRKDNLLPLMTEVDWNQVIQTNLGGTFNMTKLAVDRMLRFRYGRIVNISSLAATIGLPGQTSYSASKAGQIAFAKSLSKEVAKRNITINNVAPGFIETDLVSDLPEALKKQYIDQVPMKRFGSVQDVAGAVLFLSLPTTTYITGSTIDVTGGL
ncbi:MAG: 3-oxoacyl-ACP reductase FabG [Bacteriovoracaceae bacterium]|nr:3-oxoacyl-ACP reductase FabG [Bacteriovoracaceae bacterium]